MQRIILESHAKLDEASSLATFLAPIPNAEGLKILLVERRPLSTRTYDDEGMVARFVRSDGTTVACYAVQDVTIDEAEMIAAQCELVENWNADRFAAAVHRALDTEPC
jgi:hypothetical protein